MTTDPKAAPDVTRDPVEDRLLDHNYDGIQEYDNPMPRWWLYIFYATIVYSALYLLDVPGIGPGEGRIAHYERDMAAARARAEALAASQPKPVVTDSSLRLAAADAGVVDAGRQAFMINCMPCHRADGGGSIGPNLTDDYWIHGARPMDVHRTIDSGVLDKGMPAWSVVLKAEQVVAVAAYVLTLYDTHPANPKEPQGTKVDDVDRDPGDAAAAAPHDHRSHD